MIQNKVYNIFANTSGTSLYSLSAEESLTISKIIIYNPTDTIQEFTCMLNTNILYKQAIPAKDSFIITGPLPVTSNDSIVFIGTDDNIQVTAFSLLITN